MVLFSTDSEAVICAIVEAIGRNWDPYHSEYGSMYAYVSAGYDVEAIADEVIGTINREGHSPDSQYYRCVDDALFWRIVDAHSRKEVPA